MSIKKTLQTLVVAALLVVSCVGVASAAASHTWQELISNGNYCVYTGDLALTARGNVHGSIYNGRYCSYGTAGRIYGVARDGYTYSKPIVGAWGGVAHMGPDYTTATYYAGPYFVDSSARFGAREAVDRPPEHYHWLYDYNN